VAVFLAVVWWGRRRDEDEADEMRLVVFVLAVR
jgi:hypothetical protein